MESLLCQIPGIGPKTVKKIAESVKSSSKNTPTTLTQIRNALRKKTIFDNLPVSAQADLTYNPIKKIPRELIQHLDRQISEIPEYKTSKFVIAGSYLREKLFSGDLDIVVLRDSWQKFVNKINTNTKISGVEFLDPYAGKDDKLSVLIKIKIPSIEILNKVVENASSYHNKSKIKKDKTVYLKADVFLSSQQEFPFHLLFATGSGGFNILMRKKAKSKNMILSQHGLFDRDTKKRINVRSERGVFRKLGMKWRSPKERNV